MTRRERERETENETTGGLLKERRGANEKWRSALFTQHKLNERRGRR